MSALEIPQTQSTAPVFEYHCLFTSDLRRKQKRWQDGQLKFHTFNNRVMVYDDRSNFVGDTHWREDELNEGEQLELERRGIMVEVGECHGHRNQDLSDLIDKPRKDKEDRAAARAAASPALRDHGKPSGSEISRPKTLNQMLTPSGRYGRALVSDVSPFVEKQQQSRPRDENDRPTKRLKTDDNSSKNGYAQNLMGASLDLSSSRPSSTAAIRYEPLRLKSAPARRMEATIDLTSDSDNDRNIGIRWDGAKKLARHKQPTSSIQKKSKKSPVPKNGYASNLTGAALSLARPEYITSRRTTKSPKPQKLRSQTEFDDQGVSIIDDGHIADDQKAGLIVPLANSERVVSNRTDELLNSNVIFDTLLSSPVTFDEIISEDSHAKLVQSFQGRVQKDPHPKPKKYCMDNVLPSAHTTVASGKASTFTSSKPTEIQQSLSESGSTKTTSSLRIKSRPPRKMMMMTIDRPSFHQSIASTSGKTVVRSKENSKSAADEIILSQATLQLDSFRRKQEERLEARFKVKRAKYASNDLSDSPQDSGIDHQTIDILLSRKPSPIMKEDLADHSATTGGGQRVELPIELKPIVGIGISKQHNFDLLHASGYDEPSSGNAALWKAYSSPISKLCDDESRELAHSATTKVDVSLDSLSGSEDMASCPKSIANEIQIGIDPHLNAANTHAPSFFEALWSTHSSPLSKSATQRLDHTKMKNLDNPDSEEELVWPEQDGKMASRGLYKRPLSHDEPPLDVDGQTDSTEYDKQKEAPPLATPVTENTVKQIPHEKVVLESYVNHVDEENETLVGARQVNILQNEGVRANGLPGYVTSAIQGDMEHLRASLGTYEGHQRQCIDPDIAESHHTSPTQEPCIKPSTTSENELVSEGLLFLESSPKPTQVDLNIPEKVNSLMASGIPVVTAGPASQTPQAVVIELQNGEGQPPPAALLPPRPRVANPATRGKSLQAIAASTFDAIAPSLNVNIPPPARPFVRINKTNPREKAIMGRADAGADGAKRDKSKSGPWSRESFDLFGAWKPPERQGGINTK